MLLYVMNPELELIKVIDDASSVIWTRRYYEAGDFEIYMKADADVLKYLAEDNFVRRFDSDMVGIIENVEVKTDPENGDYITVTGRDLKSLLARRIVWTQTNVSGTLKESVEKLLQENIISPSVAGRGIANFILGNYTAGNDRILAAQYTGNNIYDIVVEICKANEIGWNVSLNNSNQFVFELFEGVDRSYNQSANPYVVFSPDFNNLLSTTYAKDKRAEKNSVNVAGEGEGITRRTFQVGNVSGLLRREEFVDARDITSDTGIEVTESFMVSSEFKYHDFTNYIYSISKVLFKDEETENFSFRKPPWDNRRVYFYDAKPVDEWDETSQEWIEDHKYYSFTVTYNKAFSPTEYNAMLAQRGREHLAKLTSTESFDGEVDSIHQYVLDKDFFIGDVVQVVNEYGVKATPRILEIIENEDENGITVIPTFETWEL